MPVKTCPIQSELIAFRSGVLVLEQHLAVARHLKICADCRNRVATILPNMATDMPTSTTQAIFDELRPETTLNDALMTTVGPYKIIRMIGKGGMGIVYEAEHEKLKNRVALKVLPRSMVAEADLRARFRREWEAIGRLDHPNIVRALHAGEADGVPFLALELINGPDFSKVVQRTGALSPPDAATAIRAVALGLSHAHMQGVIHRDVKPSNVLLTEDGTVKLLDMGLASLTAGVDSQITGSSYLGTADYMAPEQWDDAANATPRSDLYSLGCVFYYLLAGQPPFTSPAYATPHAKMRAHKERPAPLVLAAPPVIAAILASLLEKSPERRPLNAMAVADALAPYATGKLDRLAMAALNDTGRAFADGPDTMPGIPSFVTDEPTSQPGFFRRWFARLRGKAADEN